MSSSLWIQHVPANQYIVVQSPYKIFLSNASLGYNLPDVRDRGSLRLGHSRCADVTCIATFVKDTHEHVRLDLVLELNVEYALCVTGPFPVDLIGYYGADKPPAKRPHEQPRLRTSSKTTSISTTSREQRKRKAPEDDSESEEEQKKSRKPISRDQASDKRSGRSSTSNPTSKAPPRGASSSGGMLASVFGRKSAA